MALMREEDLLASFLIDNEFQDTISFAHFVRLFPSKYRTHPDLKDLYRLYLSSRSSVRAIVRENIAEYAAQQQQGEAEREEEKRRAHAQRKNRRPVTRLTAGSSHRSTSASASTATETATVAGSRGDSGTYHGSDESDDDMGLEGTDKHLTLPQAIDELLIARGVLEAEIERLESECQQYAEDIQSTEKKLDDVNIPSVPFKNYQENELFENLEQLIQLCDAIAGSQS
ncbi:hypothetical protein BGW41_006747 [Actinomortierella wolfii]|nr:hypothetical protein BGW41_006747 [Actinomortierella wolfii]